jgi:hypothetical protein
MDRDTGLRRTALLTGALIAAGVVGTVGVGIAAYAADSSSVSTTPTPSPTQFPSLSGTDDDGGGQATSGGS